MAWMEHRLHTLLKRYVLSMEGKMAAGAFGRATNYGRSGAIKEYKGVLWRNKVRALRVIGCPFLLVNVSSLKPIIYRK